jgi:hypothetical protein
LRDIRVDGRIISINMVVKELYMRVLSGFNCFSTGTSGGLS